MGKPKNRRRWIWIVLIVVVILCLISALFIVSQFQLPQSTPPPPQLTTLLTVDISSSKITAQNTTTNKFEVPANSALQIQSTDATTHDCKIQGTDISVRFSNATPSAIFRLAAGTYRLTCDNNPNRFASIIAK